MEKDIAPRMIASAGVVAGTALTEAAEVYAVFEMECIGADGQVKWRETFRNLVTTEGKNDILNKYFKGSAYTAAWYVGIKGSGTPAATDTMASHAGWTEVTAYTQAARQALTLGTPSAGAVSTSSAASYSINASTTAAGAFVCSDSTKGGTTGVLYNAGDFPAARSLVNGDTLNVNLVFQA